MAFDTSEKVGIKKHRSIGKKGNRYNTHIYTQEGTRSRKALRGIDGFRSIVSVCCWRSRSLHDRTHYQFFAIILFCFCSYLSIYTIIPFHFVQQLFFVWVVCYQMEMEHNFISRMSERVTLGYQIKNSSFPSSFLLYSYFAAWFFFWPTRTFYSIVDRQLGS